MLLKCQNTPISTLFISGPISAALAHTLTYKVVVIFAGVLTGVSLFVLSYASEIWHIYLIISFCGEFDSKSNILTNESPFIERNTLFRVTEVFLYL